eukprot:g47128.t1
MKEEEKLEMKEEEKLAVANQKTLGVMPGKLVGKLAGAPSHIKSAAHKHFNALTRTQRFQTYVRQAFEAVDADRDGKVSEEEAYAMVLLLYLKVAAYITIYPTTIPSRERVCKVFHLMDEDKSGFIDREEFYALAVVLCEGLAARLGVQLLVTLLISPAAAIYLIDMLCVLLPSLRLGWLAILRLDLIFAILLNMSLMPLLINKLDELSAFWFSSAPASATSPASEKLCGDSAAVFFHPPRTKAQAVKTPISTEQDELCVPVLEEEPGRRSSSFGGRMLHRLQNMFKRKSKKDSRVKINL